MTRKTKIGIAVAVVVALAAGAVVVAKRRGKELPEVTVEKVTRGELVSRVTANGRIEAKRKVELSSNVMGQIVNLAVREGDRVAKGDFLLQIDQTQLAASAQGAEAGLRALFAERDAARASLAEARRNHERAERSYASQLIPLSEVDRTRAALDSASATVAATERRIEQSRANLAGARDTLSKTRIVAPMAGVVTRLPVEEGEVAVVGTMNNPGTQLMTISDMSEVEAVMEVDETDLPQVRVGQPATVTLDAYGERKLSGVVTEVASSPIQAAGGDGAGSAQAISFEVRIQLDDPPADIRPGFSCSADITTDTRASALQVPIQALVVREPGAGGPGGEGGEEAEEEGDEEPAPPAAAATAAPAGPGTEEEGVYTLDRKAMKVRFVPVETGITGDTKVEVRRGLEEGQEIVTGPFRALREIEDGAEVKVQGEGKKGENAKRETP
jgi:HlyD family secretion protein